MIRSAVIFIVLPILIVGCSAKIDSEGYYRIEPIDDPFVLPYKFTITKKKVALGTDGNLTLQQYVPVDIYGSGTAGMYLISDNWRPADTLTAILFYADTEERKTLSQINVKATRITSHLPYDFDGDSVIEVAVMYTTRDTLWLDIIDPHQRRIHREPLVVGQDRDGNGFWDGSGAFCGIHDFNGDGHVELLVNCDVGYDLYPRKLMCVDWFNKEIMWEYEIAGVINSEHTHVESLAPGERRSVVLCVSSKGNAAKAGDMDDRRSYLIVLDHEGKLQWKKETGGVFSSCVPVLFDYGNDGTTDILTTYRYEAPANAGEAPAEYGGMFKIYDRHGSILDSIDHGAGRVVSSVRLFDFDSDGRTELFVSLSDATIIIYDQRLQPVRKAKFYTAASVWDCRDFIGAGSNQLLVASTDNKLWLLDRGFMPLAQFGEGEDLHCGKSAVYKERQSQQGHSLVVAGNGGQVNYFLSITKSPWNALFFRYPLLAFLAALLPMSLALALIWFNWHRTRKQKRIISQQRDRLNTALEDLKAAQEKLIAIEEYDKTQDALRESENRYKTLVENLPQRIFLKDKDSIYVSCNQNYARDLRIKPDEIAGKTDYEFYPKELAEKYRADDKRIVESGKIEDIEERYIQNGRELWVHTVKTPVKDEKGNIVGVLGIFWDITEHKQAEEALREKERRYALATSAAKVGVWDWDLRNGSFYLDPNIKALLGYEDSEIPNDIEVWTQYIHPDDKDAVMQAASDHLEGRTPAYVFEHRMLHKDGTVRWFMVRGTAIHDASGNVVRMVGTDADITERKRIEAREKARLELLNDLRTANNIDACLDCGCKAIYEARLFRRAVLTLHNDKREIVNLGRVGLDDDVVRAARNAPAPDEELSKSMTQEKHRISHSYFIPEEAGLGLNESPRHISPTDHAERRDSSWKAGDELFVPIIGNDNKHEGWLSVDTPFDGERPTVEIVRFLEQVVDIVTQKVREIRTLEKLRQEHRALLESEERFRNVSASAQDAILMMDNEGRVSFWNEAAERVFGYRAEEIIGKPLHETLGPERFHDAYRKGFAQFRETGEGAAVGQTLELAAVRKDGTEFPIELSMSAIKLKGKWNAVGILRDITERKNAQEALRDSEARYQELFDSVQEGLGIVDENEIIRFCNAAYARMFGEDSVNDLIGKSLLDYVPEDQRDLIISQTEMRKSNRTSQYELDIITARNHRRTILASVSPRFDKNNQYRGAFGAIIDITDRKRAEEALRESEERYRTLFESSAEGILVADIDTKKFKYANPAMCRMLGYTEAELKRMGVVDIHPQNALEHVISEFEAQARGEKTLSPDIPCLRKDGTTIYADINATKVLIDGKECNVGFLTDITERKQAEEALRSERDFVHSLLDTANGLIVCLDNQAKITVFNRECEKVTGYTREEVIGKSWPEIFLPEDHHHHRLKDFAEWVRQHPQDMYEGPLKTKSGQIRTILWSNSALFSPDSDELTAIAVGQDITERKEAERRLQIANQERYDQAKQIAGGVAHEIHNALYPAASSLAKLKHRLQVAGADERARNETLIALTEKAIARAISMTELVTRYSKLESEKRDESVYLRPLIQDIINDNKLQIEELGVTVSLDIAEDVSCNCCQAHIYSLFNNLMVNALEALAEVEQRRIAVSAGKEGDRLRIEFSDTGAGIPPENVRKIFTPFFSTKPRTGTGLGLAMAKRIVELYDGNIEVNSSLDKGTRFTILLTSR